MHVILLEEFQQPRKSLYFAIKLAYDRIGVSARFDPSDPLISILLTPGVLIWLRKLLDVYCIARETVTFALSFWTPFISKLSYHRAASDRVYLHRVPQHWFLISNKNGMV